ncbi:unnamed protein product [Nezara viridula]|uniref:Androgen-dependent TFPI-regulating protein-like n=1 Tax=Nezara viridula TaxID=85310 RepID=A0A9P0MTN3_NEZVI|nr:unnamed protein product [Nezara viridula]
MAVNERLLHVSIFGINLAVLIRLMMVGNVTLAKPNILFNFYKRFNMRFLTKWTFMINLTYYFCMVLVHILNMLSVNSKTSFKLRRFADALFTTIVVPIGMFITLAFWTIYLIDKNLIFPNWLEEVIPLWVNHGIHTFNSVLPLVDLVLVKHTFSTWPETVFYIALYFASYMICLFGTYFQHGIWLYPIFSKMTFIQSVCFCLASYFLSLIIYFIVRLIGIRLGTSVVKSHQKEKKHSNKSS